MADQQALIEALMGNAPRKNSVSLSDALGGSSMIERLLGNPEQDSKFNLGADGSITFNVKPLEDGGKALRVNKEEVEGGQVPPEYMPQGMPVVPQGQPGLQQAGTGGTLVPMMPQDYVPTNGGAPLVPPELPQAMAEGGGGSWLDKLAQVFSPPEGWEPPPALTPEGVAQFYRLQLAQDEMDYRNQLMRQGLEDEMFDRQMAQDKFALQQREAARELENLVPMEIGGKTRLVSPNVAFQYMQEPGGIRTLRELQKDPELLKLDLARKRAGAPTLGSIVEKEEKLGDVRAKQKILNSVMRGDIAEEIREKLDINNMKLTAEEVEEAEEYFRLRQKDSKKAEVMFKKKVLKEIKKLLSPYNIEVDYANGPQGPGLYDMKTEKLLYKY